MYWAIWTLSAVFCTMPGEDLKVLQATPETAAPSAMLYEHLKGQALAALERRQQEFEAVKTPEQAQAYQKRRREFFQRQLGPLPERTPLNARVVGSVTAADFRVEKVLLESQPHHHVTGLLYLPSSKPPYPGVLIPCGHSFNGKAAEQYQRAAIMLAKHGIAAFCYDPIGQGERYQTFGPEGKPLPCPLEIRPDIRKRLDALPGQPRFDPVQEHTLIGLGSILLGTNVARYRIHDGMRALDYLVSRPEIDLKRIGCTGNSGGGTLTAYLMALDDRIACAGPGCYLTTFRRLLETAVPQDAEQSIFGQIAFGLDQADYVLMRAPKPTIILAGTKDVTFDIAGTWDVFREAKRFYARLGYPERVDMVDADEPHGFTLPLRVGATRWMRRWLLNTDDAVTEPDFAVFPEEQLYCTPKGQVMLLPAERSVFDLNREREEELAAQRRETWSKLSASERTAKIRQIVGARPLAELPEPKWREVGMIQRSGYRIDKLILEPEAGIQLPALAFVPAKPDGEAVLYLHGDGKQVDAQPGGPIEALVAQGQLVLAVDLRGLGETAGRHKRDWSRGLFGTSPMEFWVAYLLGQSLVGLRTEDTLVCARFAARYRSEGTPRKVQLVALGAAGVPALHAAVLEPGLFTTVKLSQSLTSWADVLRTPAAGSQLPNVVHGALKEYDLPELRTMLDPN